MTTSTPFQHRYAVIAELAVLYQKKSGWLLGKTALQKLVYFLQEVRGVQLGYEYTLYTFGPYSSTLAADLDGAALTDVVSITYDPNTRGYEIKPSDNVAEVEKTTNGWLKEITRDLDAVFDAFGKFGAKQLELRATIAYVMKDAQIRGRTLKDKEAVGIVHELKPHFEPATIKAALGELREVGFLPEARSKPNK